MKSFFNNLIGKKKDLAENTWHYLMKKNIA